MFKKINFYTGSMCRDLGQKLDKFGATLQGNLAFKEQLSRHRRIMPLQDKIPTLGHTLFIAPDASVIGNVKIGPKSTVWYGAVIKGDLNEIKIGEMTSFGDRSIGATTNGYFVAPDKRLWGRFPSIVGSRCIIESGSVLHSCTVEDESIVGSGSMIFEGAVVSKNAIVGAGSVVPQGTHIPTGELWSGNPVCFERKLTEEEIAAIPKLAETQFELARKHDEEHVKSAQEIYHDQLVDKYYEIPTYDTPTF